jgi:hypothetical protein
MEYSGDIKPDKVMSHTNRMLVVFTSDHVGHYRGFFAVWTAGMGTQKYQTSYVVFQKLLI